MNPSTPMTLNKQELDLLRREVRRLCGIDLGEDKAYLVLQRLEPLANRFGLSSLGELGLRVQGDADPALRDQFINAITTNETSFFRDGHPFRTFHDVLMPELVALCARRRAMPPERKGAKVSILSAAASTGQEPYSIAMTIHDYLSAKGRPPVVPEDFRIVATDISSQVLARAMTGDYSEAEAARGLTEAHKAKHFRRTATGWAIGDPVKRLVDFRRLNLTESFVHLGGFDVIFCRNVLIYFDIATRKAIFDQFHHLLAPGGTLLLGSTENMYGITDRFESRHCGETVLYGRK